MYTIVRAERSNGSTQRTQREEWNRINDKNRRVIVTTVYRDLVQQQAYLWEGVPKPEVQHLSSYINLFISMSG